LALKYVNEEKDKNDSSNNVLGKTTIRSLQKLCEALQDKNAASSVPFLSREFCY